MAVVPRSRRLERLFLALIACLAVFGARTAAAQTVMTIADARALGVGATVTVEGIVTVAAEFNGPYYIQDSTAALAVFKRPVPATIIRGAKVRVTGKLEDRFGQLQVGSTGQVITQISTGNVPPAPKILTVAELNAGREQYESQLVRLNNVTFVQTGNFTTVSSGSNFQATDASGQVDVRINTTTNIAGTPIPVGPTNIQGVVGEFNGLAQLIPRSTTDINLSATRRLPTDLVTIRAARGLDLGDTVTVRGTVTSNDFGGTLYIQDETAGVALYAPALTMNLQRTDIVKVTGRLKDFNGVLEFDPIDSLRVVGTGPVVEPTVVTLADLNEFYEGSLVRINGVTFAQSGTFAGNTNYSLSDGTATKEVRVLAATNLVGTTIPSGTISVVGILGQFKNSFSDKFQLQPRSTTDLIRSSGPQVITRPIEIEQTPTAVTFGFTTSSGTPGARYGRTTAYELGSVVGTTLPSVPPGDIAVQRIALTGLRPATVYYVQPYVVSGADTSYTTRLVTITASPDSATGRIDVFFNGSVDNSRFGFPEAALGNVDLAAKLVNRVDSARFSIDVALYSLNLQTLIDALINAKMRGVKVRVARDGDNSTAGFGQLTSAGISVSSYANSSVDTHNKFFIFDARDSSQVTDDWVWTGSLNATNSAGGTEAYQNSIQIQDPALARIYQVEFEEMFGSTGETANQSAARFSINKADNTPHRVPIKGTMVEVFFSPSDNVQEQIANSINSADHTVAFELLNFTRLELAAAVIARRQAGIVTQGIVETDGTGSQVSSLKANGVDIYLHSDNLPTPAADAKLLHHKYAIIDGDFPDSDPRVLTGSQNWSTSSLTQDDENILILHSNRISRLYLQEFAARYAEQGGTTQIPTDVVNDRTTPDGFALNPAAPNPFNPTTTISYQLSAVGNVRLDVFDALGRRVKTLVEERQSAGAHTVTFDGAGLPSGLYLARLTASGRIATQRMTLVK